MDVLSSIVVLISVMLSYFDIHLNLYGITVDQIGAALILVFITHSGWELLSDGMRVLLDASIDFATLDRIRDIVKNEPMVNEIKSLMGRSAGRFRFIQATVTLNTEDLERAHQVSENIEEKIRRQVTHIEKVTIRCEPRQRAYERVVFPLEDKNGRISLHFGEAPYFGILHVRRNDRKIEKRMVVENPHRSVRTAKGIRVAEWLLEQGVDHIGMKEDVSHKGPGYVFSNGGVKMHTLYADHMDQAIREIVSDGA